MRTAGFAEGGRGGEDKKDGNMDEGNVDLSCNKGYKTSRELRMLSLSLFIQGPL